MISQRMLEALFLVELSNTRPRRGELPESDDEYTRRYRQWHADIRAVATVLTKHNRAFDALNFIESLGSFTPEVLGGKS